MTASDNGYSARTQTAYEFMSDVRSALYEYSDMVMLANRTGLSEGTLYAIRSGRTQWPRWTTLQRLLTPLGLEITLKRVGAVDRTCVTDPAA